VLPVTIEDLTPAQRDEIQQWMLLRFEQLRRPKGRRRRTDRSRDAKAAATKTPKIGLSSPLPGAVRAVSR
jgi:hypothetical protein